MSDLPSGWWTVTLGELADAGAVWFKGGYPSGSYNENGEGVPHLRPFNVSAGGDINMTQVKSVAAPAADNPCWLRRGDVVFNNTNSEDLVGKTALFDSDERMVLSNHMTIIRPTNGGAVDGYWMARCLHRLWDRRVFKSLCRRYVGQASIDLSRLKSIWITLPPLPEQRAIAAALRAVKDTCDACRRELALERERKAALMEHLFTCGVRGELQKETAIGFVPRSWCVLPLRDVCVGSAFGPRFSGSLYAPNGNVATLRTTDIDTDGNINLNSMPLAALDLSRFDGHLLQHGDLLVTRSGTCGIASVFEQFQMPVLPGAFLIRVRLAPAAEPHFLRYYINSARGRRRISSLAVGAVQKNINGTRLLAFLVPLPPLEEQRDIAEALTACDRKIAALEREAVVQDELFRALLEELMTGRLSALPLTDDAGVLPEVNP